MRVLFYCRGEENPGIEYLSAAARAAGHETGLVLDPGFEDIFFIAPGLFKRIFSLTALQIRIREFSPDVIAYSCLTLSFHAVRKAARRFRSVSNAVHIAGGPHATAAPEAALDDDAFDYVMTGESDRCFPEFLRLLETGGSPADAPNIASRNNGHVHFSPSAPLVEDLDTLPLPDRDLFIDAGACSNRLGILTARNCPYGCTYCSHSVRRENARGLGKYFRQRSVRSVIDEILLMQRRGFTSVRIWDDIFGFHRQWKMDFLRQYAERIRLPFSATMHVGSIDAETARALRKAGCTRIALGIQSGDDDVRRRILDRKESVETSFEAVRTLKAEGIFVLAEVMLGLPGETQGQMENTKSFCEKAAPDNVSAFVYFPMPGTKLAEEAVREGYLSTEVFQSILKGCLDRNSWHRESLIESPHATEAFRLKIELPLKARFPRLSRWIYARHELIMRLLFYFSIPFVDEKEFRQKLRIYCKIIFTFFTNRKIRVWTPT